MAVDISKVLPIEKIYDDALSPAMKQFGGITENTVKCLRFVLAPIDALAAQQDRYQRFLQRVSDKVPEENMVEANPDLATKVLEGLRFQRDDGILAEMFINLLAKAINKEELGVAHPAFATIISNLVPDEALILYHLSKTHHVIRQSSSLNRANNTFGPKHLISNTFPTKDLAYPDNFFMYSDHLHSLNLTGIWQVGNQQPIMQGSVQTGVNITSHAALTEFGRLFAKACLPDDISQFQF
jgi:hypothetical protein